MAGFVSTGGDGYRLVPLGAESNVAVGLAQLGCKARWVSRLGRDQIGRLVADAIGQRGVDVVVEWDDSRQTGVMIKEIDRGATTVRYYRSESAASALGMQQLDLIGQPRWVHLTGITPALSATAAELTDALLNRDHHGERISFDFNYRPSLWASDEEASRVLVELARRADLVFIGEDESSSLLGVGEPLEIAEVILNRPDQEVVVKRHSRDAWAVSSEEKVAVPALQAQVVDLTGAGDGFAAGYLAATCWGWPRAARVGLGHRMAARIIGLAGDLGPPLSPEELAGLERDILGEARQEKGVP